MTTRDEIMAMDEDALRLAVAKACGYRWYGVDKEAWLAMPGRTGLLPRGVVEIDNPSDSDELHIKSPNYPRDLTAAIALLDGMTYPPEPDGRVLHVEYVILKEAYRHLDDIDPLDKPRFIVEISSRNPIYGDSHWATAGTLPRAACEAWLMWMEAKPWPAPNV